MGYGGREPEARHRLRIQSESYGERSRRTREVRSLETARIKWLLSYITFSTRGRRPLNTHSHTLVSRRVRSAARLCAPFRFPGRRPRPRPYSDTDWSRTSTSSSKIARSQPRTSHLSRLLSNPLR